ncbi:hypothetical protein COCON_G00235170, partial [Conger conger]
LFWWLKIPICGASYSTDSPGFGILSQARNLPLLNRVKGCLPHWRRLAGWQPQKNVDGTRAIPLLSGTNAGRFWRSGAVWSRGNDRATLLRNDAARLHSP